MTALAPRAAPVLRAARGKPPDDGDDPDSEDDSDIDLAAKPLTPQQRNDMLAAVAAGRDVRLQMDIVAFRQTAEPNANYVRFTPAALRAMAPTFEGAPFLKDHNADELGARAGRILSSTYEGAAGEGEIRQTVELSAPWAVDAALRGLLDRFSIGWRATSMDQPRCSICDNALFSLDCGHFPGDRMESRGTMKTCEALYTDVVGSETSAVNVPAVEQTGIESIRAALSALRTNSRPDRQEKKTMLKVLSLLGLAAEASEESAAAAIERLRVERDTARELHAAAAEALATVQRKADEAEAQLAAQRKAEEAQHLERLIAACRAKVGQKLGADHKPERGGTRQEKMLLALAARDLKEAEAFVAELPQMIPTGSVAGANERAALVESAPAELSAAQRQINKQLGISDEQWKSNAPRGPIPVAPPMEGR